MRDLLAGAYHHRGIALRLQGDLTRRWRTWPGGRAARDAGGAGGAARARATNWPAPTTSRGRSDCKGPRGGDDRLRRAIGLLERWWSGRGGASCATTGRRLHHRGGALGRKGLVVAMADYAGRSGCSRRWGAGGRRECQRSGQRLQQPRDRAAAQGTWRGRWPTTAAIRLRERWWSGGAARGAQRSSQRYNNRGSRCSSKGTVGARPTTAGRSGCSRRWWAGGRRELRDDLASA